MISYSLELMMPSLNSMRDSLPSRSRSSLRKKSMTRAFLWFIHWRYRVRHSSKLKSRNFCSWYITKNSPYKIILLPFVCFISCSHIQVWKRIKFWTDENKTNIFGRDTPFWYIISIYVPPNISMLIFQHFKVKIHTTLPQNSDFWINIHNTVTEMLKYCISKFEYFEES